MTRKKYRKATVKLIIGCILMGASVTYLNHHPAEKMSLISGVDVLMHKGSVLVARIQGKDTVAMEKAYQLTRYIHEVIYTAQHTSGCKEHSLVDTMKETIQKIQSDKPSEVALQSSDYRDTVRQREDTIRTNCGTNQS